MPFTATPSRVTSPFCSRTSHQHFPEDLHSGEAMPGLSVAISAAVLCSRARIFLASAGAMSLPRQIGISSHFRGRLPACEGVLASRATKSAATRT